MRELADGLFQLRGLPPNAINVYVAGDVLVDAGSRLDRRRIVRQLAGRRLAAHALTHAHPDHQGSSHAVCEAHGIPLWCGAGDVDAAETGKVMPRGGESIVGRLSQAAIAGPGHPVERALRDGDEVAGFAVLETPGHSPGHVSLWRESDRTLIVGDVLFNLHPLLGVPGLREPPRAFTPDPARNRDSARRLAALEPRLVCFGHGPPLRDTRRFVDFVARLPS